MNITRTIGVRLFRNLTSKRTLNTITSNNNKLNVSPIIITSNLINKNAWIWKEESIKETPSYITNTIIDLPKYWTPLPTSTQIIIPKIIETPPSIKINKIEAARLIVIRRRKMKKHKLRKLRKRMKFEWAKVRQRRELRKEKEFQAKLIAQIKEGEKFSAEQFVSERIRAATEKPLPRFWKGKRLPAFIIRQKLGLDKNNKTNTI
ncbi:uncharacterized protein LOC123298558 [Chrysoperla carnea]|uniref:uncharacterized protein LOC123298558 n=1 Tax=Chrysoperla carnea TaxID=189513 RepID=UPI001D0671CC|nr:uncharacterized protein LOC123298558 [Chrysoperla carnea]